MKVHIKKAIHHAKKHSKRGVYTTARLTSEVVGSFYFLFFPVLLLYVFFVFLFINDSLVSEATSHRVIPLSIVVPTSAPYPLVRVVKGTFVSRNGEKEMSEISAQAAIVVDDDSKVVLFAKNQNLRFPMASTTKIMTALSALDYYQQNDILEVKTGRVAGAVVGLEVGERMRFREMLYAMLLPSGNDVALAIAQNYPGGESAFVRKMNEKAKALHLADTHFSDPTGLDDEGNFTTVYDLARLASIAVKNPLLAEVVSTKKAIVANAQGSKFYDVVNLNKLLGTNGVDGIKTGFTHEAGEVLVTSRVENGHRFIMVVMRSQDRFSDTRELISYFAGNVSYIRF